MGRSLNAAAGAPIKVWFLPEMHPEGKIKLRDMNVQVRPCIWQGGHAFVFGLTCMCMLLMAGLAAREITTRLHASRVGTYVAHVPRYLQH